MAYADLCAELSGTLPGLSGFLAENFILRAYRKVRDARLWSFLIGDGSISCPAALMTGTFSITQGNPTITSVDPVTVAAVTPLLAQITTQQIRLQATGQTSQIYRIVSAVAGPPLALTLDRPVQEPSNTGSAYLLYRCYVTAPPDFLRWISVVDMQHGWPLTLDRTSWAFDKVDPQRASLGQAMYLGSYQTDPNQELVQADVTKWYELWPGPVQGQQFYYRYRRRGQDFTNPGDVQNAVIPDDLILQCALGFYAYPWCAANPGHFPALAKTNNWMALIQSITRPPTRGVPGGIYYEMLQDAKRQDDNSMMQSVWNRGHGLRPASGDRSGVGYPIDADYIQQHLVPL